MPALKIRDLHVSIGHRHILDGVDLEVAKNAVTMIFGSNGAGKSSLMRAISGLLPWRGNIVYNGKEIEPNTPAHRIVQMGLIHVPEDRGTLPELTVEENLQVGAYVRKLGARNFSLEMEKIFDFFPILVAKKRQLAGTLSGGEQQFLALGRALIAKPSLLMLDEPCMGLSPLAAQQVFSVLERITAETRIPLLINEQQNLRLARQISHTVYLIESGKVVGSGPAQEILDSEKMRQFYFSS